MKTGLPLGIVAVLWFVSPRLAMAVSPTPREMAEARRWSAARFDGTERFFSFAYDSNRHPPADQRFGLGL